MNELQQALAEFKAIEEKRELLRHRAEMMLDKLNRNLRVRVPLSLIAHGASLDSFKPQTESR